MAKGKLDDMMGALGAMPEAGKEPATALGGDEPKESTGEVSDEEMSHAEDLAAALKSGDTSGAAAALKRFVKACTEGGYDEPEDTGEEEPPASQREGDM